MIWGEEDSALGKETTHGTEKFVADFTIRYLPGVSHWVQQEAPERAQLGAEMPVCLGFAHSECLR